jgi:predicted HNH restriction endonuclease
MIDSTGNSYIEKPTYRSEIIAALRTLGGQGRLSDIYAAIADRNILPAIATNPNWQAQVRKQLQSDSSDTRTVFSGKDLFFSVEGLHGGIWGIRDQSLLETEDSYDYTSNGEYQGQQLAEGLVKRVSVNVFERNRQLRNQCINLYGTDCVVCAFNFVNTYGIRGDGFIEVHHIVPLSEIRQTYTATPSDLRPVCSNCHSMIHRFKPFLTIGEITDLVAINRQRSD